MLKSARMMKVLLAALVVLATLPALASAQSDAVAGPFAGDPMSRLVEPGDSVRLSDEKKVTRWAHATDTQPIRSAASTSARTVTRLRYFTEDKLPEVYLVLEGKLDSKGDGWLHIRVPMRPNGRTGWVPVDALSSLKVVQTQLVVDRTAKRATLFKAGRKVWQASVGIGKSASPTPQGNFWVRELLRGNGGAYGYWAFGTSAYSNLSDWPKGGVVGIHGTNQPGLIPGRPSSGCVRVRNDKMARLARLMPIGTPIDIVR